MTESTQQPDMSKSAQEVDASERARFEAHVLAWTGRDIAYHTTYGTTGIEFGWSCWQAAADRAKELEAARRGWVLVRAYERCGRWADDAPSLRAECEAKIKCGTPCERCPDRAQGEQHAG